jgi:hypothetical protein
MDVMIEHQSKKVEASLHILEEFKVFISDCTTGLLLYEKHHVATLLGCCLVLLCHHLSLHKVLKSKFRILIDGSKVYHHIIGVTSCFFVIATGLGEILLTSEGTSLVRELKGLGKIFAKWGRG